MQHRERIASHIAQAEGQQESGGQNETKAKRPTSLTAFHLLKKSKENNCRTALTPR